MYSRSVTERIVAEASRQQGWALEEHSQSQIDAAIAHFADLLDDEGNLNKRKRPNGLHKEEIRWIQNERKMCALDFRYWLKYATIIDWEKRPTHPTLNVAQEMTLDIWSEHEEQAKAIILLILKARQLGQCLDPETKVLTADLKWRRLEDVAVGEELVSVDEFPQAGPGKGRKMLRAVVEAKRDVYEDAYHVEMSNGVVFVATGLHRFLCRQRGGSNVDWRRIKDTVPGDKIRFITKPWGEPVLEDAWMGGILDGEGSLRQKTHAGVELCASQVEGPVYDRIKKYFASRGYTLREDTDRRLAGTSSKLGSKIVHKAVIGRMNEMFQILGQTRPTRFIDRPWWEGKELPGKNSGEAYATVVGIRPLGQRRMIDLQTSTQTFIAEGFVSHNSTIYELGNCHRFQFWPHSNIIIASADPKKTVEMGQMIKFCLDSQPWWLLPQGTVKYEKNMPVEFNEIHTRLSIQAGNQFHGVARGGTPNCGHLSEVSAWANAEEDIDASFIRAIHETSDVFVGLESTAKGLDNWFARTWNIVKEDWPRGRSRIRGTFLPWYVGTDIYPPKSDLWRFRQMQAEGWTPNDKTINHAERAREYVLADPLLFKHLAHSDKGWKMPLEQMWYYEVERETAQRKKSLNKFLEECTSDDQESFQNTGISVIDQDVVINYHRRPRDPPIADRA